MVMMSLSDETRLLMATRKIVSLLLLLVVVAAMLAACGGDKLAGTDAVTLADLPNGFGRGFGEASLEKRPANLATGQPAPDFRIVLNDGRYVNLSELQGRPVIINFWATWCPPCRAEMPDLVRAYEAYDDLVVLAANVEEPIGTVSPFADQFRMSMPIVLDPDGALQNLYQVSAMPTSYFIDRDGNIAAIWRGLMTPDVLADMLAQIL